MAPVAQAVASEESERLVEDVGQEPPGRDPAPLRQERIGIAPEPREPRLHYCDERRHGGKRKLKADAENGLRFDRDDGEDREGEIAHGQRPPVQDHRAEHDQCHDEGALGSDPRTGCDVVKERGRHRHHGRPFLDRVFERERRRQGEQPSRDDEDNAGDQGHLHAGNRDDVEDARLADKVLGVVGEEVALARDHGGGDRAFVAADDCVHPEGESVARVVDRGAKTLA